MYQYGVDLVVPLSAFPGIANRFRSGFRNVAPFRQRVLRHSLTLSSFVNRDHAIKKLFQDGFLAQIECLSVNDASKRCVLSATSGSPGAGKSYFLDKLASLSEVAQYARVHFQQRTVTWLGVQHAAADFFAEGNVLTLNITFNSDTQVDTDESNLSFGHRAVLRLLFKFIRFIFIFVILFICLLFLFLFMHAVILDHLRWDLHCQSLKRLFLAVCSRRTSTVRQPV
jgi:hypothetical protein